MKICTKCKELKEDSEFRKHNQIKSGLTPRCKTCLGKKPKIIKTEKNCWKCKQVKPLSAFYPNKSKTDGLTTECIDCNYTPKVSLKKKNLSHKVCTICKKLKPISNYSFFKKQKVFSSHCRKCVSTTYSSKRSKRLKKVPNTMPKDWWNILLDFYNYQCCFPNCDKEINEKNPLTHDHVIPVSWEGSSHSLENSQILCRSHNCSKNNHSEADYRDGKILSVESASYTVECLSL